jgi:hypothetical protein
LERGGKFGLDVGFKDLSLSRESWQVKDGSLVQCPAFNAGGELIQGNDVRTVVAQ